MAISSEKFDFNLIRYLVVIVDTRSMVNAAEMLDVAPSAVSYAVKKLREHYKDPLFIRSLNGVKPTTLALNLYDRFKLIHDDINAALNIESLSVNTTQKIYIRADALTEFWIMDRLLATGIVPNECTVEFNYSIADTEERIHKLRTQEIDIDVGLFLTGDTNIVTHTLFDWMYILICRHNHSTLGNEMTKEQFLHEPFLAYSKRFSGASSLKDYNEFVSNRTVEPTFRSESSTSMILSLLNHDVVMFIPDMFFPLLKKTINIKEVKCQLMPKEKISVKAHINKKNKKNELINKIISILREDI